MEKINRIVLRSVSLSDGFWKSRTTMVAEELIPYQWETLNNRTPGAPLSHAVENFRIAAGEAEGEAQGTIFQDSDVAKWIEAASYSLLTRPDSELEAAIDELVRLIEKSQLPDGYVNTFFIAGHASGRWTDLTMGHELYCAGHMIEAAVAYYQVTGKDRMLNVMSRYADYIGQVFGPGEDQIQSYDGHPEIELALYRLAEATGNSKYADLADFFVNIRSSVKDFHVGTLAMHGVMPKSRWFLADYYLAHKPVRDMCTMEGHAVRAVYLYSAVADQYRRSGDAKLWTALRSVWQSMVSRRMYLTAGIGSQAHGERFTVDYDLPPATGYNETCASVGLVFWAQRMSQVDPDGEYADVIERAIYNGALSGVSLDGKSYFYVNPLEVSPEVAQYREDHSHVATHRAKWFECSCCPTNIARLIASVGNYIASYSAEALWIHQYAASTVTWESGGAQARLSQETNYPWSGSVRITVETSAPVAFTLYLRIPGWCNRYTVKMNGEPVHQLEPTKGYLALKRSWSQGDTVELDLDMPVRFVRADDRVRDVAGKVALQRGPIVYCFEEFDNGPALHEILLDPASPVSPEIDNTLMEGTVDLSLEGYRDSARASGEGLYGDLDLSKSPAPCRLRAVPYFQWGNRAKDQEMRIWMRVRC